MIKYFVIRNFRGKCSSVGVLKGYMVRERLGTPDLHNRLSAYFQSRALLYKEALPWSLTKPQIVPLFYLTRLVSVTSKQEVQTFGNSLRNQN